MLAPSSTRTPELRLFALACAALFLAGTACKRAEVPEGVQISVNVDGKDAKPITTELLRAVKPSYTSGDRRAWTLESLVGPYAKADNRGLDMEEQSGIKTSLRWETAKGQFPVLAMNKRGDMFFVLMRSGEEIPGHGGSRSKGEDAPRRIKQVRVIQSHRKSGAAVLSLLESGQEPKKLSQDDLEMVGTVITEGDEEERPAWPVREVLKRYAGSASLAEVKTTDGETVTVSAADWADAAKVPVLRVNRRGLVKFFWVTPSGGRIESLPSLKGVAELSLRQP